MAERGVEIRQADYNDLSSLNAAFAGTERLLFVSSPDFDDTQRILQHANVLKSARDAGVSFIAYTGLAFAEATSNPLRFLHLATENAIRTTGIPFTFLRDAFYSELFINPELNAAVEPGKLSNNAGDGRFNTLGRQEMAHVAARVLLDPAHENQIYNLTGPLWTYPELAAVLSEISGKTVRYVPLSFDEYVEEQVNGGAPEGFALMMATLLQAAANGEYEKTSDVYQKVVGEHLPLEKVVKRALAAEL